MTTSPAPASPAPALAAESHGPRTLALTLGALGVVYGDIGTSPLYAFREALAQAADGGIVAGEILGVLSLAIWALILVVTVKYVLFLLRADNNGEGGVLSLMALAQRAIGRRTPTILVLGAAGAALFYGDAVITPALSVLSAVEGLKTVPGVGPAMNEAAILGLTITILAGLFAIQSRGTASVGKLFGPICSVWFAVLALLGLWHVGQAPDILLSLNPAYAVSFLAGNGMMGLFVLGAVFLTVTGAEALTADMGHFGRKPIQLGWLAFVFPALSLNYLGQGAMALVALRSAEAAGTPMQNADWFFLMAPEALRAPVVILATLATIIASQAVITGAYSLTQQGIALGLLPRLKISQTSEHHAGQIYMPVVNWLLLAAVLWLVIGFRSSSAMAAAYGIAVTGTMVITTCLAFLVVNRMWKWNIIASVAFIMPFLAIDLVFFGANILRIVDGGWVPVLVASIVGLVIWTWVRGRALIEARTRSETVPLEDLAAALERRPPVIAEGTAIFLAQDLGPAPAALLHNLKHNKVLHARNLVVSVRTANKPRIDPAARLVIEPVSGRISRATLTYGYMEVPDVPADLLRASQLRIADGGASFFISRNTLSATPHEAMPFLQDLLFIFLHKNSSDPTQFYQIPPNRVVELGSRIDV